jgi:hypothetical protein
MILQTTTWICGKCNSAASITEEVFPFDSIVIKPPKNKNWSITVIEGEELLLCPTCSATFAAAIAKDVGF